jgi:UrcA family protein
MCAAMTQRAAATQIDDVPAVVVKYDARSLTTEPGIRALYRRLESAARQVCPAAANQDLDRSTAAKACSEAALDRAIRQINHPRLVELQVARTKHG